MKKLILFISILLIISCSSKLYVPKSESSTVSVDDLKTGREIYVKKCSSCHQLFLPNQYNEKAWSLNLTEMQDRAKITDAEKQLIYQYIVNAPK
ncbi:c-type cytochrome [Flavobacterium soyangense]|uniref:Cytochrome c n=1 Tax=Flavobacterium soyangense TaxID=2023265 RepID=A0A930UAA0_9FLAO|nr:cytochrome c [Flavobacterium soyangense]MBF2708412.1 cytochrome c [Flavobacterium soyangense]